MRLTGSPLLKTAIKKNVKEVTDPRGRKVYDQMVQAKNEFSYGSLPSASDYASFYQFVGTFKGLNIFSPVV